MTSQTAPFSATDWLAGRLPAEWFTSFDVTLDREEILIHGTITSPDPDSADAQVGRISRFREDTRAARIEIAGGEEIEADLLPTLPAAWTRAWVVRYPGYDPPAVLEVLEGIATRGETHQIVYDDDSVVEITGFTRNLGP